MCGIFGFNWPDSSLVRKGARIMEHRGPDDEGYYVDDYVSLGMRRLAIIDLSGGKQPMCNEDGTIWVIFNGEIYNYREIRKKLTNHRFKSESDTEVIIHAYEEWGERFVEKLNGMFAIAIWDSSSRTLILLRDKIGIKPLYYYWKDSKLIFGSEIKSILEYTGIKREADREGLLSYLGFGYCLGKLTLFKDINELLPANYLKLNNNKILIKTYWDIKEQLVNADENFFKKKLKKVFEDTIKHQVIADVPVGTFLSGGIDSSIITTLVKRELPQELHTFTAGFDDYFSEIEYAKQVSQHIGTVFHEINITEKKALKNIDKITWHSDEPISDAAMIPRYFLSKEARKYVKVVLTGEGGDELFVGYQNYLTNLRFYNYFKNRRLAFLKRLKPKIPFSTNPRKNRFFNAVEFLLKEDFIQAHMHSIGVISENEIRHITILDNNNLRRELIVPKQSITTPVHIMTYLDIKNLLPGDYLMKADKTAMANSVEERVPFLDENMVNLSFSIPQDIKLKDGIRKYILKESFKDSLPKNILTRKKSGFGTPLNQWMKGELREVIVNELYENELIKEYFKEKALYKLLSEKNRGIHLDTCLWSIFALGRWHKMYLQ